MFDAASGKGDGRVRSAAKANIWESEAYYILFLRFCNRETEGSTMLTV